MEEKKKDPWDIEKPELTTDSALKQEPTVDVAATLGLLTAACQLFDKEEKEACWKDIEPLEKGQKSAEDALYEFFKKYTPEKVDEVVERINYLIYTSATKAKQDLEKEGKLK